MYVSLEVHIDKTPIWLTSAGEMIQQIYYEIVKGLFYIFDIVDEILIVGYYVDGRNHKTQ